MLRALAVLLIAAVGCDYTTIEGCPVEADAGSEDDADMMHKKGWSGNFGSSQAIAPQAAGPTGWGGLEIGGAFSQSALLVDISSSKPEPDPVLITLRGAAPGEMITDQAQLIALVQWGLGGATNFALVDFGQTMLVEAESVKVAAMQRMITGAAFPPAVPLTVNVAAMAAPGHVGTVMPPQFTASGNTPFAVGVALTIPIPPFARSFKVAATPNTSALRFDFDNGGGIPFGGSYPVVAFPSASLPIPGAVNAAAGSPILRMTNVGGAAVTSWRVMFELGL